MKFYFSQRLDARDKVSPPASLSPLQFHSPVFLNLSLPFEVKHLVRWSNHAPPPGLLSDKDPRAKTLQQGMLLQSKSSNKIACTRPCFPSPVPLLLGSRPCAPPPPLLSLILLLLLLPPPLGSPLATTATAATAAAVTIRSCGGEGRGGCRCCIAVIQQMHRGDAASASAAGDRYNGAGGVLPPPLPPV